MSYKSLFTFTGIILCAVLSLGAHAQVSTKAEPYFTSHEMPDMLNWYPAPPKEGSEEYVRDIKRYYWGKQQRLNPERAAIAVRDARYGLGTILREFSIPFGLQLEKKNTPEIYKLLRDALATTDSICKLPSDQQNRPHDPQNKDRVNRLYHILNQFSSPIGFLDFLPQSWNHYHADD